MNRQQFNSRNNINKVLRFQKSGSTSSFDPFIAYGSLGIGKRVSWRLDNGTIISQTAGNSITYTGFTSDTSIRDIEMRGNNFEYITTILLDNDNLYGNFDSSQIINGSNSSGNFNIHSNSQLTGFTQPQGTSSFLQFNAYNCDITGHLDLSNMIIGNPSTPGTINLQNNTNLTGITFGYSNKLIGNFNISNCNLYGNLDITPLQKLGGIFSLSDNINLTGVTHTASTSNFTSYGIASCNLIGNLDLTPLSGLGGNVLISNNPSLTSIAHTGSTQNFTTYQVHSNDLTGTLDLSMLTSFGGLNSSSPCYVKTYSNSNLTNILFPTVTTFFRNSTNIEVNSAFALYSSNLDYIDFKPLSGATLLTGATQGNPRISLRDNNMVAGDVNHILVDFSGNTTVNPTGWSNVNLNIGGTNADPDSSSGGYDGLAAIAFLTGSPYNWTITY
jgi:hypothetical protein